MVLANSDIPAAGEANANQSNDASILQCKVALLLRRSSDTMIFEGVISQKSHGRFADLRV